MAVEPDAGEDELQLRALPADEREGFEQALVILVRPRIGRIEDEWLARALARVEPLLVDAEGNHTYSGGIDTGTGRIGVLHVLAVDDAARLAEEMPLPS